MITSATIDPHRFAAHFAGAPVLEVSGRTYPVEVRYRPVDDPDVDPVQALCEAVDEVCAEGPGDVLVFLSGEREIRDAADALREHTQGRQRRARDRAAVRAAVGGRAAQGVRRAPRPPRRAGNQRRGDLADRPRHPLRRRHRQGAYQPLQPAAQGAAAPDRAHLAGLGQPAVGALWANGRRHRDPALLRGRLRQPAGVHRAGDPAHQPGVGRAADGRARAGRAGRLPVRRPARPPQRPRRRTAAGGAGRPRTAAGGSGRPRSRRPAHRPRPPAGPAAARPAPGPDGPGGRAAGLRARGGGDRRRPVDPGPARASDRQGAAGRPGARAVPRPDVGPDGLPAAVAVPARGAAGPQQLGLPPDVPVGVPALPAGTRVAGHGGAAAAGARRLGRGDVQRTG